MAEYRVARTTSFARCPESHLKPSLNPARKGPAVLSIIKIGKTKKVFCQWCCKDILDRTKYAGLPPGKYTPIDAAQTTLV